MPKGKIVKALSGFYDVLIGQEVYRCKGRGVFRNQKITPLVGDEVEISVQENYTGTIQTVYERENELIRPPVSNVDQAIIVTSMTEPDFNPLLLDRFLILVENKDLDALIVFSKEDLVDSQHEGEIDFFINYYQSIGYDVVKVSSEMDDLNNQLEPYLANKISVIAGQSGVGKSTILNQLDETLEIETGDISKSLGRGKHTTRHVELYPIANGYVADTPGFSALDFDELQLEDIRRSFREFLDYEDRCKFRGCYHMNEPKCAVKQAVDSEEIKPFRYEHYKQFYEEIKNRKPRY
ncbi:ribosome small subunit-dependent GTPase A [Alkalibacillus haloalkaliphilus]|uniref:ribosome small subunit-dependent GTPase A n=1 Tax=Alkalibacillus haloalkaliphilus TaxID=94136 RepID=UPI002935EB06|nr:ribosome small subunit-dependent GTPase A [Alkalibacillus haloalkaliphilus]MDV2582596.1 ribosome small subunit-dependent GTPase A [Alkalibacillus haloalkaliphilus]